MTFQHDEGSLEEVVEDLKERGVEFPAEISDHDWEALLERKPKGGD